MDNTTITNEVIMKFNDLPLVCKIEILKPQIDNYFNSYPDDDSVDVDHIIRKYNLEYLYDKEYNIINKD